MAFCWLSLHPPYQNISNPVLSSGNAQPQNGCFCTTPGSQLHPLGKREFCPFPLCKEWLLNEGSSESRSLVMPWSWLLPTLIPSLPQLLSTFPCLEIPHHPPYAHSPLCHPTLHSKHWVMDHSPETTAGPAWACARLAPALDPHNCLQTCFCIGWHPLGGFQLFSGR